MRKLTGGIDATANGRYRVRIRKKTVGIYDTWDEAERTRIAALEIIETELSPRGETVGSFGKHVLAVRERTKRVRDSKSDWSRWRTHVEGDPIERINVRALRADHIEAWLDRLEGKELAVSTRRNCLNLLRVVLRAAVKKRLARANVAIGIRVEGKSAAAWTYLTPAEQAALLAATPEDVRPIVAFALGTGLRAGELVALHLADVHVDVPEPHIVVRFGGGGAAPTKTESGVRTVPLFGIALEAARAWIAQLRTYAPSNPRGLMFPLRGGGARSKAHVLPWKLWKGSAANGSRPAVTGIVERAGITRNVRWHDLRHTCASSLVSGWWGRRWTLEEVKEFLGHSSITITQRYAHLAPSAVTKAAAETRGWGGGSGVGKVSFDAQDGDIATVVGEFVNRRSRVQISRAAPRKSQGIDAQQRSPRDTALALLRAVAESDEQGVSELAQDLAGAVLDSAEVKLALAVAEGGAFVVTRAIDLAERVLDAELAERRRAGGDP